MPTWLVFGIKNPPKSILGGWTGRLGGQTGRLGGRTERLGGPIGAAIIISWQLKTIPEAPKRSLELPEAARSSRNLLLIEFKRPGVGNPKAGGVRGLPDPPPFSNFQDPAINSN